MSALCHSKTVITLLSVTECPPFNLSSVHVRGNLSQAVRLLQSNTEQCNWIEPFSVILFKNQLKKPCLFLTFAVKVFKNTSN